MACGVETSSLRVENDIFFFLGYKINKNDLASELEFYLYPCLKYSFNFHWHVLKWESCPKAPSIWHATSSNFPATYCAIKIVALVLINQPFGPQALN